MKNINKLLLSASFLFCGFLVSAQDFSEIDLTVSPAGNWIANNDAQNSVSNESGALVITSTVNARAKTKDILALDFETYPYAVIILDDTDLPELNTVNELFFGLWFNGNNYSGADQADYLANGNANNDYNYYYDQQVSTNNGNAKKLKDLPSTAWALKGETNVGKALYLKWNEAPNRTSGHPNVPAAVITNCRLSVNFIGGSIGAGSVIKVKSLRMYKFDPVSGPEGNIVYEFESDAQGFVGHWGGGATAWENGKLVVKTNGTTTYVGARKEGFACNFSNWPVIAVKVDELPAGVGDWKLSMAVKLDGVNYTDIKMPASTAVMKDGMYIFDVATALTDMGKTIPTATLTADNHFYLEFGDCESVDASAEIDWIRSFASVEEAKAFAGITTSAPSVPTKSSTSVYASNDQLIVDGISVGTIVSIYNSAGMLIKQLKATSGSETVNIGNGLYIVKVGNQTFKVVV